QQFIRRQTSNNAVVQEDARIVVLNGTTVNGLAVRIQRKLTSQGLYVASVGDARNPTQTTTIIDASNGHKSATYVALAKQLGSHFTTINPYADIYDADFIVILG